jgi:hypothetical protein
LKKVISMASWIDFPVLHLSGSIDANGMIVDPTAASYLRPDDAKLFRKCGGSEGEA